MRKVIAILLALFMSISVAACGGSASDNIASGADKADSTASTEKTDQETTEATEETTTETPAEPTPAPVSFEEMTVVDNEECLIKITGLDPDDLWGYNVKVYLENRSADKTYMFSLLDSAVNGVEANGVLATTVAPGKKTNDTITFYSGDDSLAEIERFTDIELTFRVYDSEDWAADEVAVETVHVYPYGEENATVYVREAQPNDVVLVDNDNVTVIAAGSHTDSIWGFVVELYLVNKTDKQVMFSAEDVSVNGYMADPYWATQVGAGHTAFSSMSWSDSTLEENGIESFEEIEMTIRAYDYNDWSADNLVEETVTYKP